jgi:hypothetical protein
MLGSLPVPPAGPTTACPAPGPPGPAPLESRLAAHPPLGAFTHGRIVPAGRRVRVLPARFGGYAAPRAGQGAVQVPLARVAVVHDAGRVCSASGMFLAVAVKVV